MPQITYKVVYTANVKEPYEVIEHLDFTCECPETAAKAYVNAIVQECGYANAKVYPTNDKPLFEATGPVAEHQCCKGKKCCKDEASKLFNGYKINPNVDSFETTDSTWIKSVSWQSGCMTVHFRNDNSVSYVADWMDFASFQSWVLAGGSAGRYFNQNVKGILTVV